MGPNAASRSHAGLLGFGCLLLAAACLAGVAVHDLAGLGKGALTPFRDGLFLALVALSAAVAAVRARTGRTHRLAWGLIACGMVLWLVGFTVYLQFGVPLPVWLVDAGWAAAYPFYYAGAGLLILGRLERPSRPLLLDGVSSAGAATGLVTAVVAPVAALQHSGDLLRDGFALAYPIADTLLLAFVLTLVTLSGGRTSRGWTLLTCGITILAATDALYATSATEGVYVPRGLVDVGWGFSVLTMAAAAWWPEGATTVPRVTSARILVPLLSTVASIGLLLFGAAFDADPAALGLATIALVASSVRMMITLHQLRQLASVRQESRTDDLTGLPNRRHLLGELTAHLDALRGDKNIALLLIDLDGFKELNDSLGHDAGDTVLEEVGERLRASVDHRAVVARLGGDEFAVILPGTDERAALVAARDLRSRISRPVSLQGIHVHVGASIGIAIAPSHGRRPGDILRRADAAMYEAKRSHLGEALFSGAEEADALDRLRLAGDLQRALDGREIVVHYQPKVCLRDGRVIAMEALARWEHPERGLLSPAAFLPALELTDLGPAFTQVVLEQAVAQAVDWRERGLTLRVAVNLTALDLRDSKLPERVQRTLHECGADPRDLSLEITESGLLHDPDRAERIVQRLRAIGVSVALDDFGTGYSSMTHLHRIKVDRLKIDRSFVARMGEDAAAAAIVEGTIRMAHALGLEVVAEGVETVEMWDMLCALDCDIAQGYLLSRPVPAREAELRARDLNRSRAVLAAALAVG